MATIEQPISLVGGAEINPSDAETDSWVTDLALQGIGNAFLQVQSEITRQQAVVDELEGLFQGERPGCVTRYTADHLEGAHQTLEQLHEVYQHMVDMRDEIEDGTDPDSTNWAAQEPAATDQ